MLNILQNGLLTGKGLPLFLAVALPIVISVVIPYLLGSINSAVLISRLVYGEDIRKKGSGNGGLTNMHRVYGGRAAGLVLLGDVLKMVLSLLVVGLFYGMQYGVVYDALDPTKIVPPESGFGYAFASDPLLYVAGLFCILGHIFPVYYKFKGGKGVLTAATMILIIDPMIFAVLFVIFALVLLITRYVSLGSVICALCYPAVVSIAYGRRPFIFELSCALFMGATVIFMHRTNLYRLFNNQESKFSFREKPETQEVLDMEDKENDSDTTFYPPATEKKKKK
jgi:glycerol-3-phosphate acyltransferase PlsY